MKILLTLVCALLLLSQPASAVEPTCEGKFANPITDICWSCIFPLTIGGTKIMSLDQEDTSNPGGALCNCKTKIGIKVGFWEPVRQVDIVRKPFCLSSLGGIDLDPGFDAPEAGRKRGDDSGTAHSFYQAHWYVNPILYWLEVLLDNACLDKSPFDIAYLTELDPIWADDELTYLINPDVTLFANLPAQAACAADCVTASAGFPNDTLFWCAGCQGSLYPLNGHVQHHIGGVQASSLLLQRLTAKMHRQGLIWSASGSEGLCGYYPKLQMGKSDYKYQMLFPVPQTQKIAGKCCQPYGRTTTVWGAGKEFPYKGEDFSYLVFRKRNCCQGALGF
ncbi:conjugal transfer pilus assembly protein TraU [Thiothrix winogradskyi]|uniref:TraU family protein n=1 Tax=Thiothrix winogradskyi TaxID=96472 RepID=A0ABY3T3J2_9GAMM|nr:conjugal transfer pilus assembly protein TraU [Thiothrix winogradskyi]UJS26417.1 TraU family protein [Thiothrix winogradskyi]